MALSGIIYEAIDDNHSYGKYGDFRVIIMNSNGYINATKLCNYFNESKSANEPKKEFRKWKENDGSEQLIDEINSYIETRRNSGGIVGTEFSNNSAIIVVTTGTKMLHGTYVHPLLVPHITSWISPKFAIQVSKIVNDYIVRMYSTQIKEKDDNISRLERKIDELLANSRQTMDNLNNVEDALINTTDNLECTMVKLSIVQDKLDIAVEDRAVKPFDKNKINQLAILRSNTIDGMYYLTCGQKASVDRAIRLRLRTHTSIEVIDKVPNSIYLFDHIKNELGARVKIISRSIQLNCITELTFIDEIKALFDGRRDIDLSKKP